MNRDVSVLIYSCDKYSDAWGPFFELLFRYWDCPYQIYITAETEQCLIPEVKTINTDAPTWTERIRSAAGEIPTKYIIGMCEDFFIRKPVKQYMIDSCKKNMDKFSNIACFNFEKDYDGAGKSAIEQFGKKPAGHNFQKSCQPTLWRKSILMELLDCKMDPWQWEDSETTEKYDFYIYTGNIEGLTFDYGLYERNPFGIVKGKWYGPDIRPLFERERINVDLTKRGVIE